MSRAAHRLMIVLLAAVGLLLPGAASACATCFGAPDDTMTQAMNLAIVGLLGVTGTVLAGVAGLMVFLVRRGWKVSGRVAGE